LPNSSPTFEMTYSFDPVETGFRQTCMNWEICNNESKKAVMQNLIKLKELLEDGSVQLQEGRLAKI
jgi:hypothetical protein